MRTIWKFELVRNEEIIEINAYKPIPLYVGFQKDVYGDGLYVWVEIPDTQETERFFKYTFYSIVTGDSIPEDTVYIGTAKEPITKEIVHVYYK